MRPRAVPHKSGNNTTVFNHFASAGAASVEDVGRLVVASRRAAMTGPPAEPAYPRLDKGVQRHGDVPTGGQAELESMWLAGFLDADNREHAGGGKRDAGARAAVPLPDKFAPPKRSYLSGAEIARLREVETEAMEERNKWGPTQAERLLNSAYASENDRIRKALAGRGESGARRLAKMGKASVPASLTSKSLDNLLYLERLEAQAAVVLQRAWRKHQRLVFWTRYLEEVAFTTYVQALWRGYCGRRRFKRIKEEKHKLAKKLQAAGRGRIARKHVNREKEFQDAAAKDIQRVYRGYFMREAARRRIRIKAAKRIQAVWRGARGRAFVDRLFLDRAATKVQRVVRRFIVRKWYVRERNMCLKAAVKIQAIFRGWLCQRQRNNALWNVIGEDAKAWMGLVQAEEVWASKECAAIVKLRSKEDVDGRIRLLEAEWVKVQDELSEKEYDFVSLQMERIKVSPRAVEQGWSAQLDKDTAQHRIWVTELKLKALFKVAQPLRTMQRHAAALTRRHGDVAQLKARSAEVWSADRAAVWTRANEMKWGSIVYDTRKKAADEKRKWRVPVFTEAGKVDLARAPGVGFDPDRFPAIESRTLTIGHGDLLALTRSDAAADPRAAAGTARDTRMRLAHALAARVAELSATRPQLRLGLGSRLITWGWGAAEDEAGLEAPPLPAHNTLFNTRTGLGGPGGVAPGRAPVGPLSYDPMPTPMAATAGIPATPLYVPTGLNGTLGVPLTAYAPTPPPTPKPPTPLPPPAVISAALGVPVAVEGGGMQSRGAHAAAPPSNVRTVGALFAGEYATGSISDIVHAALAGDMGAEAGAGGHIEGPSGRANVMQGNADKVRGKKGTTSLTQRVWRSHVSRYAGTGHDPQAGDAKHRLRTEVPSHVAEAREGYAPSAPAATDPYGLGQYTGGEEGADGASRAAYGYGPDPYYGYGWGWGVAEDGTPAPLFADGSLAVPGVDGAWPAIGTTGWGIAVSTGVEEEDPTAKPRVLPAYMKGRAPPAITDGGASRPASDALVLRGGGSTSMASTGSTPALGLDAIAPSSLPAAMQGAIAKLQHQQAAIAALARLPPGLAGARRGAAAATIASSRRRGVVGTSAVISHAAEKAAMRREELAVMDSSSSRVNSLAARVAALTGQAELVQYGALAKPLMDGMAALAMQLTAADGAAAALGRSNAAVAARTAARAERLESTRVATLEATRAGASQSLSGTAISLAATLPAAPAPEPAAATIRLPAGAVLTHPKPATKPPGTRSGTAEMGGGSGRPPLKGKPGSGRTAVPEPVPEPEPYVDMGPTPAIHMEALLRTQAKVRERGVALSASLDRSSRSLGTASLASSQPYAVDLWAPAAAAGAGAPVVVPPSADVTTRLADVWSLMDELDAQRTSLRGLARKRVPFPKPT